MRVTIHHSADDVAYAASHADSAEQCAYEEAHYAELYGALEPYQLRLDLDPIPF